MSCSTCYSISLPACPEQINIKAGLEANTLYHWEITDKFNKVYNGISTTDADGILAINVSASDDIPKGLFMSFSGTFILKVMKNVSEEEFEPAEFAIDTVSYDCVELLFKDYAPASNYFNINAPVYASEAV